MRKIVAVLSLAVMASFGSPLPATANTSVADLGRVTARAVIAVDASTNQVLFARNPHKQLPPASTTKLLTATIALESGGLDRPIRVSRYASSMQPTKIWLQPGWTASLRDLLYAMLLRSANDASVAIAEGLGGGSVPNFARMMNSRARALGATDSNFMNPNGLPNARHYSSAADLAKIVKVALKTSGMRRILSTPTKTIRPNSKSRKGLLLRSTNRMISRNDFKLIGKTGYTRLAKRCFAGAASGNGKEVIVVVLGSSNLWGDLELLIDFALRPSKGGTDWSADTGWRQALVPKTQLKPPAKIAQGDTTRDQPASRFLYHVQLASLKSRTLANDLLKRVSGKGYNAVVEAEKGNRSYRVIVRDLANRAIARRVARQLGRELDLDPQIIAVRG